MSDTTKNVIKVILVLELLAFGIGAFFTKNILYWALGIAVGTVISAARLILLERTLKKSLDMPPQNAQSYTQLHYSMRMIGIVAAAFIVVKVGFIDIVGFVIGLLPVQPAVYIQGLLSKKDKE